MSKSRRNYVAKELWTPKFRQKIKEKREKPMTPGTKLWYESLEEEEDE